MELEIKREFTNGIRAGSFTTLHKTKVYTPTLLRLVYLKPVLPSKFAVKHMTDY